MADVLVDVQSTPLTPAAGQAIWYVDSTSKKMAVKNDAGFIEGRVQNFSTASQAPAAAVRTYIIGSAIAIPTGKLQIGTMFRWKFNITKTGAGSATSTFDIAVGTAGTTADTARVSFTKPAGTAIADEGVVEIIAICRGPLSASGIFAGEFTLIHNLASTGHAVIPCVCVSTISGAFDVTVANLIVGVCITSGASDAITIQLVQAEALNL
jgi:hypothetical protein